VSPDDIIGSTSLAGIDLSTRDGRLRLASESGPPPAHLVGAFREHKPAIVAALAGLATVSTLRTVTMARCRSLTPADLTDIERREADHLAAQFAEEGTLGQFVGDLCHTWNALIVRDRLAVAYTWHVACGVRQEAMTA